VSKKDIAWQSDKKNKFGSDVYPSNFQKGNLIGGAKLNESIPVCVIVPLSSTLNVSSPPSMIFLLDLVLNIFVSS
jgi:hypothetical protein